MSKSEERLTALRLDRRGFVKMGLKTTAALAALPAASAVIAGCGGGEERAEPAPAPPADAPTEPAAPSPPQAAPPQPAPPAQPAPADSAGGSGQLVTEVAAMSATVQALQYVNESAKPDQNCKNCLFYTAQTGGRGKCQLFAQGLVSENGWCASWAAKQPA